MVTRCRSKEISNFYYIIPSKSMEKNTFVLAYRESVWWTSNIRSGLRAMQVVNREKQNTVSSSNLHSAAS